MPSETAEDKADLPVKPSEDALDRPLARVTVQLRAGLSESLRGDRASKEFPSAHRRHPRHKGGCE
jgi:hypothetical protein